MAKGVGVRFLAVAVVIMIAVLCFGIVEALSAPFLVCDPQAGVTEYEVDVNGAVAGNIVAEPDGSLRYDLAGSSAGAYTFRARCRTDTWPGWSDWSDPFDAVKAGAPGNVRVAPE